MRAAKPRTASVHAPALGSRRLSSWPYGRSGSAQRGRAIGIGRRVWLRGLPPTAQVHGGAVRLGSRGRLKLGLHAPRNSRYLACSNLAAPISVSSRPEFQESLAEAAELALLCCWEGAWSVCLQNSGCPIHCKTRSSKFSNPGQRATQHPAPHTLQTGPPCS